MDITSFIKSKDIREYLRSINYQFSALEAAWIIWQSKCTAISEKHKAWEYLIDTMPDCEIAFDSVLIENSLFTFLRELIALECARIKEFKCSSNAVYVYLFRDPYFDEYVDSFEAFSSYEACLNEIKQQQNHDCYNTKYIVRKLGIDKRAFSMEIGVTRELDIWRVNSFETVVEEELFEIDLNYYHHIFQEMRFNIPVPFKSGDVLRRFDDDFYLYDGNPFVFAEATRRDHSINFLELEYYREE